MNLYDLILRDDPVAAYRFGTSSATTYANLMGDSNTLSTPNNAGSPVVIYPGSMISGPGNSIQLGNGWAAAFTFNNRFNNAFDKLPFSLELVVKLLNTTPGVLGSHASSTDGLYFDGDNIEFSVDFVGGTSASVLWPVPDFTQNYHVVGTYNGSKVSLFIDGALVGSTNIPDGSVLAVKASQVLNIGLGGGPILLEAPAFYDRELSGQQVAEHYRASRQNIPAMDAVGAYGGRIFKFIDDEREVIFKDPVVWRDEGLPDNVVTGDYLQPVYGSDDLSQAGTFTYSINSADPSSASTQAGTKLEWNGNGNFTVEISINNGSSWVAATNGIVQPSTVGLSMQTPVMVRITFASGRAKDLDVVRNMTATVYSTLVLTAENDKERKIIFTGSTSNTSSTWSEPIEMDDAAGSRMNNASAILQESTETDLTNIGTMEFWVRMDVIGSGYIFDARNVSPSNPAYLWHSGSNVLSWPTGTISAVYVNGVAVSVNTFTPVAGRWYHIVVVWVTPFNSKVQIFAGSGTYTNQYNMVAHYAAQLTASQAAALYASYFGAPALSAVDSNTIVVSETAPAAKAYVNDWAIQGAG